MLVDVYQLETGLAIHQPLMGPEQYAQPRTRDIFQPGQVEYAAISHDVQELLGFLSLRGIQPSLDGNITVVI